MLIETKPSPYQRLIPRVAAAQLVATVDREMAAALERIPTKGGHYDIAFRHGVTMTLIQLMSVLGEHIIRTPELDAVFLRRNPDLIGVLTSFSEAA